MNIEPLTPEILRLHLEGKGHLPQCCIAGPVVLVISDTGLMGLQSPAGILWTGLDLDHTCRTYNAELTRYINASKRTKQPCPTPSLLTVERLDICMRGEYVLVDGPLTLSIANSGRLTIDDDFDFIYYGHDPSAAMKAWNKRVACYQAAEKPNDAGYSDDSRAGDEPILSTEQPGYRVEGTEHVLVPEPGVLARGELPKAEVA